jgi:N-acetylmuramoyl-L-alanine amidase
VTKTPLQAAAIHLHPLALAALGLLGAAVLPLQAQSIPALNRNVIVLDPAHGGADTGARIADHLAEKDVTLGFATRLRSLLTAAGFTVIATRDAELPDLAPNPSTDQRAGTANHARALACLLLHATPSGSGAHLFTSTLPPARATPDTTSAIPWNSAQSSFLSLSLRLANELGVSLLHSNIPPLLSRASIRPIDNLTCPAVAIELAPLAVLGADPTPLSDPAYQQRAAQALTEALISWRNHAAPLTRPAAPPAPAPAPTSGAPR